MNVSTLTCLCTVLLTKKIGGDNHIAGIFCAGISFMFFTVQWDA